MTYERYAEGATPVGRQAELGLGETTLERVGY